MRAHHRHVAGVIMRAVILLVGLVVLFIDDDQAQIGIGQKQRRARADHDRRLAGCDRGPIALPRARRQFRMPFQRTHAETLGEAIEELSGQRDLRHQDQRLLSAPDDFRNRLEIDFRLARTGDAVEQRDMEAAIGGERAHGVHCRALLAAKTPAGRIADRAPAAPAAAASPRSASVPSSTRPSITPALTPASRAASDLPCSRPSDSTSISRRRAGVKRRGGSPTSRTPSRIRSGPRFSPIRRDIRSTMPRAESV